MNDLLCCPFCGGDAVLTERRERIGYGGYERTHDYHLVICANCDGRGKEYEQRPLVDYTSYTVSDFRQNPVLRAKVEDDYEAYIEQTKQLAVDAWNRRAT